MLNNLTLNKDIRTFSVCPENPTGKKGEGGKATLAEGSASYAASELGQGWKVNPYIVLPAGETAVLADVKGEGEIKFYIDGDTEFPSICGTGTEDYFCGAYNFDVKGKYTEFSSPYTGLSKVGETDEIYKSQRYFDMYRWHITDPIYFKKDLRVTIQALGWRKNWKYLPLQDDISSVAYWYSDNLMDEYPAFTKEDLEMN